MRPVTRHESPWDEGRVPVDAKATGARHNASMAREISVHCLEDFELAQSDGMRVVREDVTPLFVAPLGNESAVYEWWSAPAEALGLPLLASIYEYGFRHGIRWANGQLKRAHAEVVQLEAHWKSAGLPDDQLAMRLERSGYLREALTIAQEHRAVVIIT